MLLSTTKETRQSLVMARAPSPQWSITQAGPVGGISQRSDWGSQSIGLHSLTNENGPSNGWGDRHRPTASGLELLTICTQSVTVTVTHNHSG